jgi:phosphoribosylanthranilate isomerase
LKTVFLKTWIKFCGTTSLEDALASVEAGADALGFIFAPSKRRITLEKARQIIRELPAHIERIGVFLNGTIEEIRRTVIDVRLTGIQLHGEEFAPEVYDYLPKDRRDELRIIKTILVQDGFEHRLDAGMAVPGVVDAWLLDSGAGSGKTFDWKIARTRFDHWEGQLLWKDAHKLLGSRRGRFIIAGGLTPKNVREAVEIFSPWGVDVVSGIEREPGRKDPEKMKAFVAAVRKAEQP